MRIDVLPGKMLLRAESGARRGNLVFDLDGTLVDSNAICIALLQAMLMERGCERRIDFQSARYYMSHGGERMVSALLGEHCKDVRADLAEFRARYLDHCTGTETLFEGVFDGLHALAEQGYTLAICSNKPQVLCDKVLRDTGLHHLFEVVVGGSAQRRPKPTPDLFEAVTARLGVASTDCIFIGDSDLDYRVARNAGVPFAFMTYGYAQEGWTPHREADWHCDAGETFSHFTDLVSVLLA